MVTKRKKTTKWSIWIDNRLQSSHYTKSTARKKAMALAKRTGATVFLVPRLKNGKWSESGERFEYDSYGRR